MSNGCSETYYCTLVINDGEGYNISCKYPDAEAGAPPSNYFWQYNGGSHFNCELENDHERFCTVESASTKDNGVIVMKLIYNYMSKLTCVYECNITIEVIPPHKGMN